jgi:ABC-type multidrug transport system ATPase subunit
VELREVLKRVGMWEFAKALYDKLSAGQRKKVQLAAALVGNPELLILDEPEANLDPAARIEVMDLIREVGREGRAVLFTTHVLEIAFKYADRITLLNRKVIARGTPDELIARYGGRWRVAVRTRKPIEGWEREGEYYVTYVERPEEVIEKLRGIEVLELAVRPPDLVEIFKRAAA